MSFFRLKSKSKSKLQNLPQRQRNGIQRSFLHLKSPAIWQTGHNSGFVSSELSRQSSLPSQNSQLGIQR